MCWGKRDAAAPCQTTTWPLRLPRGVCWSLNFQWAPSAGTPDRSPVAVHSDRNNPSSQIRPTPINTSSPKVRLEFQRGSRLHHGNKCISDGSSGSPLQAPVHARSRPSALSPRRTRPACRPAGRVQALRFGRGPTSRVHRGHRPAPHYRGVKRMERRAPSAPLASETRV